MLKIIKTEFMKMKRYNILYLGILSVLFSIILATFQIVGTENSIISYSGLSEGVIWNHFSLFLPFTFTLLIGYFINREYKDSTIKNILVVPFTWFKIILGKIIVGYCVVVIEWLISFTVTLLVAFLMKCSDITLSTCMNSLNQLFIICSCCYVSVLPIIIVTTRKPDKFLSGVAFAFVYGFCGIFVANGPFINIYPMTAGLVLAGYPHSSKVIYVPKISLIILLLCLVISLLILCLSKNKKNNI